MNEHIVLTREEAIATVTLNRPKVLNALDIELAEALAEALESLERDADVRVVVLRGAGAGFMAGGDVRAFHEAASRSADEIRAYTGALIPAAHRSVRALYRMPQPVVASVSGAVAGIGVSFMLAADLVLAAERTRFNLAYAGIGASPDGGATYALPRLVGLQKAMEIALLAEFFDASEAERLGLVNRVVPADRLDAATRELAERLARGPAYAYARTKALLRGALSNTLETQLQRELEGFSACSVTADFAEGVAAFVEKRKAQFRGC